MSDDDDMVTGIAARMRRGAAGVTSFMAGMGALGAVRAAEFQQAPTAEKAKDAGGPDTILGLIHVNTAFFIAVGVIAAFWFLFGGERKAKIGRKN